MRKQFSHTSGAGLFFGNAGASRLTLAADSSFADLTRSTLYMLVNWTASSSGTFCWKSWNSSVSFGIRIVGIEAGGRLQALLSKTTYNNMIDAELFPRQTWVQIAVAWQANEQRLYKSEWPKPLREVSYNTNTLGSGGLGGGNGESNRPWIIGNTEPTGSPAQSTVQSFRYYNEYFDRDEVIAHQYEFGPARHQVINLDMGVRVNSDIHELVRGTGAVITSANEVDGLFARDPEFMPEFIGVAGGGGAGGIIPAVFHQRFHNLAL